MRANVDFDRALLQRFYCFQDLDGQEADALLKLLEPVCLAPGESLFRQGEPSDCVYVLVKGQAQVRVSVPGQADHTLATVEAGAILGEIGFLLNEPRTATVVAGCQAEAWRISRAAFQQAVDRGDGWAHRFLLSTAQVLARRLGALDQELVALIRDLQALGSRPAVPRVAELEQLRSRLLTQWTF